jgi:ATP/maltotriose-dependent transcriptional regulator MalT
MRALCEAVSSESPDLIRALPDAFENAGEVKTRLAAWFRQALKHKTHLIAVDDLHHLRNDDGAWRLLVDLIDSSEGEISHWVLATRTRPSLPTVEWIAKGSAGPPIDELALAFTTDDVSGAALNIGVELARDNARYIHETTRGWPLLTMYALRLLQSGTKFDELLKTLRASGVTSIANEILGRLSSADVRLLVAVALYDGALLEDLEECYAGSSSDLYRLASDGVPLILGGDNRWRVHDVLRDHLLRPECSARSEEANHILAVLEEKGRLDQALRIALEGATPEVLTGLIERHVRYFADFGNPQLLRRALSVLSKQTIERSSQLNVLKGLDEMAHGQPHIGIEYLRRAVQLGHGAARSYSTARLLQSLTNWEGHAQEARVVAQDLGSLPQPDDAAEACDVFGCLAQARRLFGELPAAERAMRSALKLLPHVSDPVVEARTYMRAGVLALAGARIGDAEVFAERAISIGERHRLFDTLYWSYRLKLVIVAMDQELVALRCTQKISYYAACLLNREAIYESNVSLFAFLCRAGDLEGAAALRRHLLPVPNDRKLGSVVLINAALLAMIEKDYWEAAKLLTDVENFGDPTIDAHIVAAREAIHEAHLALLHQLTEDRHAAARTAANVLKLIAGLRLEGLATAAFPEIEISQICAAAILAVNGKRNDADPVLERLSTEAHDKYRRDLAQWVGAVLNGKPVEPSDEAKERANGIISLIRRMFEKVEHVALTPTELRILEMLALGRSTKEIASMVGRSARTVDNHVSSILRKLQAQGRGEAVARARRSGLLDDEKAFSSS